MGRIILTFKLWKTVTLEKILICFIQILKECLEQNDTSLPFRTYLLIVSLLVTLCNPFSEVYDVYSEAIPHRLRSGRILAYFFIKSLYWQKI